MMYAKKWLVLLVCLVLPAILFSCGSSVTTVPLPDIASVWVETATVSGQVKQTAVFSLDASNNIIKVQATSSQADLDALAAQFTLSNPTVKQISDTMLLGNDVAMVTVTGTLNGQAVTLTINGKLLDGKVTNAAGQVTTTYSFTTSIPVISYTSTTIVTKTGTLGADGKINYTQTVIQQDGKTSTQASTAVWTLQSGSALK
jgi:hypothetical protein